MKDNGEIIQFIKQKDYVMVNNNLGNGSFGKTVILKDPFINELFVAKKYEPAHSGIKEKFYAKFLDEIKILYKLNHKNIVRIYNYYAYEHIYSGYILMEYIEGKRIDDYIINYESIFDIISLDELFLQLIEGFQYIESNKVIHRDIREGNILIENSGIVKIIDFGIGKIFDSTTNYEDSLVVDVNRLNSDTLPMEYYEGVYTSKTDMFYLGELFNRLLNNMKSPDLCDFSYQDIMCRMMEKNPNSRFNSFSEIRSTIDKSDFEKLDISKEDKEIYQSFSNEIFNCMESFIDERVFSYDVDLFISKLEKVLRENCFEDYIQKNSDILNSIINGRYKYLTKKMIKCNTVKKFYDWYKSSTINSQKLILNNIISKLSVIPVINSIDEIPF